MFFEILLVSILAAIISIDVRTIGGTMLSRPLVVGPVVGLVMGDLTTGFIVAVLVELLWIGLLPIGAYLPVENLPITAVTVAVTVHLKETLIAMPLMSLILFSLMVAIPLGYVGRWSEIHIRNFNSYISRRLLISAEEGNFFYISAVHYADIGITFMKNFVLCFIPIWFGHDIFATIITSLPHQFKEGVFNANWLIPALGFAVVMEIFLVARHVKVFFISFACSIGLFYLIKVIR